MNIYLKEIRFYVNQIILKIVQVIFEQLQGSFKRQKIMILFRPVNQVELNLIIKDDWKKFPPRLVGQPIFYPVLNEAYAEQITKEWNVPTYGIGHVLKFEIQDDFIKKYEIQKVGLDHHVELWIPSEELEEMNNNMIGKIELISSFKK